MTDTLAIYDHKIGKNISRELTNEEQAIRNAEIEASQLAKEQAKIDAEKLRLTKIAAYEKLGLTEAEIEALLPTPKPLVRPTA
jgi:hypothetical protein